MFAGVFYKRNVEGLWVTAEGRIYTTFDDSRVISYKEFFRVTVKPILSTLNRTTSHSLIYERVRHKCHFVNPDVKDKEEKTQ